MKLSKKILCIALFFSFHFCVPKKRESSEVQSIQVPNSSEEISFDPIRQKESKRAMLLETQFGVDRGEFYLTDNPAARKNFDIVSYYLRASYDRLENKLLASVTIEMNIADTLQKTVTLNSDVFSIQKILQNDQKKLQFTDKKAQELLEINLPQLTEESRNGFSITIYYTARALAHSPNSKSSHGFFWTSPSFTGLPQSEQLIFTDSEPSGPLRWMPCSVDPTDRATFSSEFQLPVNEEFVSNGKLISVESVDSKTKRVKYNLDKPIPSYVMAFALGKMNMTEASTASGTKVKVWTRRSNGLQDPATVANDLSSYIGFFESLMIPYPWGDYSLVFIPGMEGGQENVSVSFQEESNQISLPYDFKLTTHELAHQWFGNYLTIETWDDLWIKEGMATLLAGEAMRKYSNPNQPFELNANSFRFSTKEAIRDTSLKADKKYNSGPYERAAWYLTQIRAVVGENFFWTAIKLILKENSFGAISTEKFLSYFKEKLSSKIAARLIPALGAKSFAKLSFVKNNENSITASLSDPNSSMLFGPKLLVKGASERKMIGPLDLNTTVELKISKGDLLVIDPENINGNRSLTNQTSLDNIKHLRLQNDPTQAKLLLGESQRFRSEALSGLDHKKTSPNFLRAILSFDSSRDTLFELMYVACQKLSEQNTTDSYELADWLQLAAQSLAPQIYNDRFFGVLAAQGNHSLPCPPAVFEKVVPELHRRLTKAPSTLTADDLRILEVYNPLSPQDNLHQVWNKVYQTFASPYLRALALKVMSKSLDTYIVTQNQMAYAAKISLIYIKDADSAFHLSRSLKIANKAGGVEYHKLVAEKLLNNTAPGQEKFIICLVYSSAKLSPAKWKIFKDKMDTKPAWENNIKQLLISPEGKC